MVCFRCLDNVSFNAVLNNNELMRHKMIRLLTTVATLLLLSLPATGSEKVAVEVLNFSEMDRWVRVTDMICGTVLWEENLEAQRRLPVELCSGDDGKAKIQLYIRIGCTKNKTCT